MFCFFILFINILCAAYVIFIERKNYVAAWAWVVAILFIPILGFLLYIFVGKRLHTRKIFDLKEEEDRFMQLLHHQAFSFNDQDTSFNDLINLHLIGHSSPYTSRNQIHIITDGEMLFKDLYTAIENATTSIHMEYYIIRHDSLGLKLQNMLIEKAKKGVEVLLVYDSIGCLWVPRRYFKELKAAGVKISYFFKSFIPVLNLRFNYRNHRKICVIDGKVGYLGGFNIGNEYMGLDPKMGYWRDTHIKLIGDGVMFLDLQFLLDWRFSTNHHVSLEKYIPSYPTDTITETSSGLQLVACGPDSKHPSIRNGYIKMVNMAKESILIQTPYFIPDDALLTALKLAALSGVTIHIMIPNKPDHIFVYWATYSYIGDLLPYGVKCYTYDGGFLHAKTIVIDESICSIGTANFDIRSLQLNFEINAFIYDRIKAQELTQIFKEDLKYCTEITPSNYTNRSLVIKTKESIARLLSPIL